MNNDSLKTSLLWGWFLACALGFLAAKLFFNLSISWPLFAAFGLVPFGIGWLMLSVLFRQISDLTVWVDQLQRAFFAENFSARLQVSSSNELGLVCAQFNQILDFEQTRLKKAQIERRQMQTVLDHMTEQVMAVDQSGKILLMNPACRQLFHVVGNSVIGQAYMQVLRQSVMVEALQQTLSQGKKNTAVVRLFLSPEKIVQMQTLPLKLEQGSGALLVLHDLTAVKKLEQVRRDFVANVSHELRTPLTSIQGYAETLLGGALNDPNCAKDFVEIIYDQAKELTGLTNQLLDLASLESGKAIANQVEIDLFDSTEQVIELLYPLAQKNNLQFENLVQPSLKLQFNPEQWTQIMTNLVSNAIKFNRPGGKIVLRSLQDETRTVFTVEDTGIGIGSENLERIFERFYQVNPARTQAGQGSGLGLAIVKHMVENAGGKIKAESVLGQGTKISVSLPRLFPS